MAKYIGVVGTRSRDGEKDLKKVELKVLELAEEYGFDKIHLVSGGCELGGDRFAEVIAKRHGIPITIFYPNKHALDERLKKLNPRAAFAVINYARNSKIALRSSTLIACVAKDRKGGTEDTIKKFTKMGKTRLILV